MKTILCYGDSNTWGYDASTGGRFPPNALAEVLSASWANGTKWLPRG